MFLKESDVLCEFSSLRIHSGLLLLNKIIVLNWQQETTYLLYISSPQAKVRHDEQWKNQSIYVIALDNWNHFTWTIYWIELLSKSSLMFPWTSSKQVENLHFLFVYGMF